MDEHAQDTAWIREAFIAHSESADFPTQAYYEEWKATGGAEGEFDRWLERVKREAGAAALREAAEERWPQTGLYVHDEQARMRLGAKAQRIERGE